MRTIPGEHGHGPRADVARAVADAWGAHVAVLDADGCVVEVNHAWRRFCRDNDGDGLAEGSDYFAVCDAAAPAEPTAGVVVDGLRSLMAGAQDSFTIEYPCHSPDEQRWFRLTAQRLSEGDRCELLVIHEDVSARRPVPEGLPDELGVPRSGGRGGGRHRPGRLRDDVEPRRRAPPRLVLSREDGTTFPAEVRTSTVSDAAGGVTGMVGVTVDTTERLSRIQEAEQQLRTITDTIGDGVCTLDDRGLITYINPPARRMLRSSLAAACGGSFFLWLRRHVDARPPGAIPTATNGSQPVACQLVRRDGTELPIEYVATRLPVGEGVSEAGWVVVFRDLTDRRAREDQLAVRVEQVAWLRRIRAALDTDGFVLHAQPITDISTGQTVQHELLLRMRDPDQPGELIRPGRFLPVAEELGLAPAIDRWVLARGFAFAAQGHPVEINLSATSLEDALLPQVIEQLLHDSGARPGDVVLEITETALLEHDVTARYFTDRIRELGCGLALDDFGTGYGGFTYLKRYPLDFLKIDIEFILDATSSTASRHVISSVVSLARAFGLQTIAEGVEDEETLQLLARLGVDLAQGYLFGRPAPATSVLTHTPPGRHRP